LRHACSRACPNPVEAQEFTTMIKEQMKTLKAFIDGNAASLESESFEL
jgi:hypothetical protein